MELPAAVTILCLLVRRKEKERMGRAYLYIRVPLADEFWLGKKLKIYIYSCNLIGHFCTKQQSNKVKWMIIPYKNEEE